MRNFNTGKAVEMFTKLNVSKPKKVKKQTKFENLISIIDVVLENEKGKMYVRNKTALAKSAEITEQTLITYLKKLKDEFGYTVEFVKMKDGNKAIKIAKSENQTDVDIPFDEEPEDK